MLFKGQGLTIERPRRATGTAVGLGASLAALLLAGALLIKAWDWPISFPQFLAYFGAGGLAALAALFAFWAYGCLSLRYVLDRTSLTISWAFIRHHIPMDRIQRMVPGRGELRPKISGLGWWGYHIGRGHVQGLGRVLFFSTHRVPEELVYVQTAGATYALSPQDPARFVGLTQRLQQGAAPDPRPAVERDFLAAHPIWADRTAQALALAAVAANLCLWGFVFAAYPDLANEITIEFPPIGDITALQSRHEIFKIPGTATAILGVNLLAGLGFQWRESAAAYLLLSGAILFQAVFWIATAVALINA